MTILNFVKATDVVGKKMTRDSSKMPTSKRCQIHFQSEFTMTFGHSTLKCGNHSREENIQERKLLAEVR